MPNLTQTSETARKTIRGVIFFIILVTIAQFAFIFGQQLWLQIFPPPPPAPTVAFGKLPKLAIRNLPLKPTPEPTYVLDTTTGQFPSFPTKFKIYEMTQPKKSLLQTERAKELAEKLGFTEEPKIISSDQYAWEDLESSKTMKINITTQHFTVETDTRSLETPAIPLPPKNSIKLSASSFMESLGKVNPSYQTGSQTVTTFRLEEGTLTPENLAKDINFALVDFYRYITEEDTTEIPILGANPKEGLIHMAVVNVGTARETNLIYPQISYIYWEIDLERHSTYPLKTVQQAWEELAQGGGNVVYLAIPTKSPTTYTPLAVNQINIFNIYLAYFESSRAQDYLQPIFVFEGQAELAEKTILELGYEKKELATFVGYIPAVSSEWVE